jgi:hypothetical protein
VIHHFPEVDAKFFVRGTVAVPVKVHLELGENLGGGLPALVAVAQEAFLDDDLVENCGMGIDRMLRRDWARSADRKMFFPRSNSVSTIPSGKRSARASVTA